MEINNEIWCDDLYKIVDYYLKNFNTFQINKKIESINYSDSLKMLRPVGLDPDKLIARNIHKKSTHIDIFNQINNCNQF